MPINIYKDLGVKSGGPMPAQQEAPEGHWEGWIKPTLKEVGEAATIGTAETIMGLASSMALWPISKLRGVG